MAKVVIFDKVTRGYVGTITVTTDKIRQIEADFIVKYAEEV